MIEVSSPPWLSSPVILIGHRTTQGDTAEYWGNVWYIYLIGLSVCLQHAEISTTYLFIRDRDKQNAIQCNYTQRFSKYNQPILAAFSTLFTCPLS